MGGACETYGREERGVRALVAKCKRKRTVGRSRCRWEANIEMNLQEIGWGLDCIDLAQDRDRLPALQNTVMNRRIT
jgi:hypothetical protein